LNWSKITRFYTLLLSDWVSFLAYPNLFGIKGFVVVVYTLLVHGLVQGLYRNHMSISKGIKIKEPEKEASISGGSAIQLTYTSCGLVVP
jgi:hypothetical protein